MMKPEDRKWLEEAMKQYTFNDADRLTECVNQLKTWSTQATAHLAQSNGDATT